MSLTKAPPVVDFPAEVTKNWFSMKINFFEDFIKLQYVFIIEFSVFSIPADQDELDRRT